MRAANAGQTAAAALLLEYGAAIEAATPEGWTSLMMCAQQGSPETIKLLLDKGADIEKRKPDGLNALMIAAAWDQAAIVQLLLDRGADINAKDKNGFSALAYAKKPAATKVLKDARLDLAVLLAEDRFEDETLTDELIDSKNRYLPALSLIHISEPTRPY